MTANASWFQAFDPRPEARLHLYCLPCAGAGASNYRQWSRLLPPWIEVRAVLLPGRQSRYLEPPLLDADQAAELLADELPPASGRTPYALFGHSMGALLSYRMTRVLLNRRGTLPVLLAAAAWPMRGAYEDDPLDPGDDDAIWRAVRRLGGSAPAVLDDPEMRAIALPVLRADFTLCDTYHYRPEAPLPIPVAAYGGIDDPVTAAGQLHDWQEATVRLLGPRMFAGGHFFVQDHPLEVTAALAADLSLALDVAVHDSPLRWKAGARHD